MLLTLFAIAIGSVVGLARGGKWTGPNSITFQNGGLLVAAATAALVQTILDPIFPVLWSLVGTVLVIAFALRNRHLAGMTVLMIGMVLNLLPLLANWAVPVSELALVSTGNVDDFGNPEISGAFESTATATRLSFLSHAIPVPIFSTVVSIGDLIALVGLGDIVTNLFLSARTRELTLTEAGVSFASTTTSGAAAHASGSGAAHAAPDDGLISILSPLQTGIRRSTDSERRRARRNKAAPASHVPAHAAEPTEAPSTPGEPAESALADFFFGPETSEPSETTEAPSTRAESALADFFFGPETSEPSESESIFGADRSEHVPSHAAEPEFAEPDHLESDHAEAPADETLAQPIVEELAEDQAVPVAEDAPALDVPEPEIIDLSSDPVWVETEPIVVDLTEDGQIAPTQAAGLFDQDSPGAPQPAPRPEIPEGTDAITAAGIQAVPVLPATAHAPQPEPVPELIDLTDPDDPRPIIDLTKSPTDEQMAEFLRRRKAADRNLERVPIRPPGQRRGRAPVRLTVDKTSDGVAQNDR